MGDVILFSKPNPIKASEGTGFRHVDCRHYESCLDFAVMMKWLGWSCERCLAYERMEWYGEWYGKER